MFISLSIRNSPLNKKIDINFSSGINVLKGKNSSGKSTVLEYLNYSLFGSTALRSPMSTYHKDFSVECVLTINSIQYKINRLAKDASLYILDADTNTYQILVTGITPVNGYLKELLTYDYKIFSLTNFCKQHELLKLTSSSPTELVNLIEIVSGLDSSYRLLISLKELRKESKTVITTLNSSLNSTSSINIEFEPNEVFETLLKEDEDTLQNFNKSVIESNELFNNIRSIVGSIQRYIENSIVKNTELKVLESKIDNTIGGIDEMLTHHIYLDSLIAATKNSLSSYKPIQENYSEEYLLEQEALIVENSDYQSYLKAIRAIESKTVVCPECDTKFIPNSDEEVLINSREAPEAPQMTQKAINSYRQWLSSLEEFTRLTETLRDLESEKNTLTSKHILETQKSLHKSIQETKDNILNIENNLQDKLNEGLALGVDLTVSDMDIIVNKLEQEYLEWKNIYQEFQNYINLKTQHLHHQEMTSTFKDKLDLNINNLKTYTMLLEVLQSVKKTIQQESFPVINSIASDVMSQVTGGERNQVRLTEDFKIEVDGLDINTIEGSGKVITNLALRVALLSTFYKDTFLVCLFDEIDESLHEDRFSYMEESFQRLSEQGYQIILTSHKDYSADNIINMDSFKK